MDMGIYFAMLCLTRCLFNHVLGFGCTTRADTFHARANSVPARRAKQISAAQNVQGEGRGC
jgi:hypothetical protein